MDAQTTRQPQRLLPKGYRAVPLSEGMASHTLRLCVVVKADPDPMAGRLVVLRNATDARVCLGCVLDGRDQVLQWTEVWFQQLPAPGPAAGAREALTNRVLDERWRAFARALAAVPGDAGIATEWDERHPAPLFMRVSDGAPVHPCESAGGRQWALCTDDAALQKAGAPPYTTSLHRYWRLEGAAAGASPLVRLSADAPGGAGIIDLEAALGAAAGLAPLNPACGLILVRPYDPLGYGEFMSVLGGGTWEGVRHGRQVLDPGERAIPLHTGNHPGRMFTGPRGQAWRLIETLHLKLSAFAQAVRCVRCAVAAQQRPFLSLSDDSFRVDLPGADSGLPFLWSARIALVDPGCAVPLPESIGLRDFCRMDDGRMTVYRPASAGAPRQTRGDLRLRGMTEEARAGTIVEGTFRPQDTLPISRRDLIGIRIVLADEVVDLYGRLEQDRALAGQEWRFRSIGRKLAPSVSAALRAAEGVLLENLAADVIPLPGAACDLHAMAVLGVRSLLVNGKTTLPVAVDEVVSLARAADAQAGPAALADRIASLWSGDPRWRTALGPHRLSDAPEAEAAARCIPDGIWRDVLCALVRMFPGVSSFSTCRDMADARAGSLEAVFDEALADLEGLLARTASLIAGDWDGNPDVQAVIRDAMGALGGNVKAGPPA